MAGASAHYVPTPCAACGAPARVEQRGNATSLDCAYCGTREPLPFSEDLRVRVLRDRLKALSDARAGREAMLMMSARIIEGFKGPRGLWAAAVLLIVGAHAAWQALNTVRSQASLPAEVREQVLSSALYAPSVLFSFVVGNVVAYGLAIAIYNRNVRGLLEAVPSTQGPGHVRCRACSGDFEADLHTAWLTCPYCQTSNLPCKRATRARVEAWADETVRAHQQAQTAHGYLASAFNAPGFLLVFWGVTLGLGWLLTQSLLRLVLRS